MSGKHKKVMLSLNKKIEIVKKLKKDENGNKTALEYGISSSTVSNLKKKSSRARN